MRFTSGNNPIGCRVVDVGEFDPDDRRNPTPDHQPRPRVELPAALERRIFAEIGSHWSDQGYRYAGAARDQLTLSHFDDGRGRNECQHNAGIQHKGDNHAGCKVDGKEDKQACWDHEGSREENPRRSPQSFAVKGHDRVFIIQPLKLISVLPLALVICTTLVR